MPDGEQQATGSLRGVGTTSRIPYAMRTGVVMADARAATIPGVNPSIPHAIDRALTPHDTSLLSRRDTPLL
jgi:hypothetical protein